MRKSENYKFLISVIKSEVRHVPQRGGPEYTLAQSRQITAFSCAHPECPILAAFGENPMVWTYHPPVGLNQPFRLTL